MMLLPLPIVFQTGWIALLHHRWRECWVGKFGLQGLETPNRGRVSMLQEAVNRVSSLARSPGEWVGTMPTAIINRTVL